MKFTYMGNQQLTVGPLTFQVPWNPEQTRQLSVPAFRIDARPMSFGEWLAFLNERGVDRDARGFRHHYTVSGTFTKTVRPKDYATGEARSFDDPITGISYEEALAFCRRHGGRLPWYAELLAAMRHLDRRGFTYSERWEFTSDLPVGQRNEGEAGMLAVVHAKDYYVQYRWERERTLYSMGGGNVAFRRAYG